MRRAFSTLYASVIWGFLPTLQVLIYTKNVKAALQYKPY
jgi:hypothetical protein